MQSYTQEFVLRDRNTRKIIARREDRIQARCQHSMARTLKIVKDWARSIGHPETHKLEKGAAYLD